MESNTNPLISVIVPCYNYGHFLGEALSSVSAQTFRDWECIIVNDGSLDDTEKVAQEFCARDKRFKYFSKKNGGHSAARNFGIRQSTGKYILPLDADDRISDRYMEKAVEVMESDPAISLVTCQVELFGSENEKFIMPPYSIRSYLVVNNICITSFFKRIDFDKSPGFDETMKGFEDWDLFIHLLKNGGKVLELPFTGFYYRKKERSAFQDFLRNKEQVFTDHLKLYNNHVDIYSKFFPSPIELVQEYEKLNKVIEAYLQSNTYRLGLAVNKMKTLIKKTFKSHL